MKNIFKHSAGFVLLFLIFNFIWTQCSFDSLPPEIKDIVELFLGPLVILSFFLWLILQFAWKIPMLDRLIHVIFSTYPYVQGTWRGIIKYEWEGKKCEKESFLVIYQEDAFSVHCRFFTDERESESNNAVLTKENGCWVLSYQYRSSESIERREENPVHSGTAVLKLDDSIKCFRLYGNYFTFRNTSGALDLVKINNKIAKSYHSAKLIAGEK